MKIDFEMHGLDNAIIRVRDIDDSANQTVLKALEAGAFKIRNRILQAMKRTPRTGRAYRRGKRWHIASSPGNAPARDMGELMSHIMVKSRMLEVEVGATAGAPYYKFLEFGTRKMAQRPSLLPAINEEWPGIEQDIINRLNAL